MGASTTIRQSDGLDRRNGSWFLHEPLEIIVKRGVSIDIYAHSFTNVHRLVNSFVQYKNVKGWYWNPTETDLFHLKAIIVDRRFVYIGSANLSENAISKSAEWGVISDSPDLAFEIERYLEYLIQSEKLVEA